MNYSDGYDAGYADAQREMTEEVAQLKARLKVLQDAARPILHPTRPLAQVPLDLPAIVKAIFGEEFSDEN